jgi:hypothetical protein
MMRRLKVTIAFLSMIFVGVLSNIGIGSPANSPRPPDPCDKDISVADVRGILNGKPNITHYSMSESTPGEGCTLGVTADGVAFVDISIRQGDKQAFQTLLFFVPPSRKAMAGVGEEAYFVPTTKSNVPDYKETDIWARKGNLICIVQLHRSNGNGEKLFIPATDEAIGSALGTLCNKLFVARGGS